MGIFIWTKPSQNHSRRVIVQCSSRGLETEWLKVLLLSQDIKPRRNYLKLNTDLCPETSDIFLPCLVIQLFKKSYSLWSLIGMLAWHSHFSSTLWKLPSMNFNKLTKGSKFRPPHPHPQVSFNTFKVWHVISCPSFQIIDFQLAI